MLQLFTENLLPVFLAAGAGYLLAASLRVEPRPIAHAAFFVFAPCLVFQAILDSEVGGAAFARMVGFTLASVAVPAIAAGLLAWRLGWSRTMISASILVVLLPNAGNYGMSVAHFAFGEKGLAQASLFFATSSILTFTVGIFVASSGRTGIGSALAGLIKVPAVWAVALAFSMRRLELSLPSPAERTVELLAGACIPTMLIVLGMQFQQMTRRAPRGPLAAATLLRLAGGAIAGLVVAQLLGLEGAARQAGALQAAMPSAVICIVLATEYDTEPEFVTSAVFLTTLLSPLSLTPLLAYLGG